MTTSAQFLKGKSRKKETPHTEYAYQTASTLQKKDKRKGYAGNEARFHFEKPKQAVSVGKASPSDLSFAHFGHKRLPVRRSTGNTKLCRVCGIKH